MKEYLKNNSLFKIAIVIIGVIYIALYYNQSSNKRYSFVGKDSGSIMDSRTGIIYWVSYEKENNTVIILDQVNGTIRALPLKRLP
jgi:hypothetical protein